MSIFRDFLCKYIWWCQYSFWLYILEVCPFTTLKLKLRLKCSVCNLFVFRIYWHLFTSWSFTIVQLKSKRIALLMAVTFYLTYSRSKENCKTFLCILFIHSCSYFRYWDMFWSNCNTFFPVIFIYSYLKLKSITQLVFISSQWLMQL